jgi:hypothetical protein
MIPAAFEDLKSVLPTAMTWRGFANAKVNDDGFEWTDHFAQSDIEGSHVAELGRSNVPRPRKGDIWFRAQVSS